MRTFTLAVVLAAVACTASPDLAAVHDTCRDAIPVTYSGELSEDGTVVTVRGGGQNEPETERQAIADTLGCLIATSGGNQADMERVASTRGIDGRQHAEWSGMEAWWTWEPDRGINFALTSG